MLRSLLALALLLAAPAAADESCTLEGTVKLTRGGTPLSPEKMVVYVQKAAWKSGEATEHVMVQKNKAFVPDVMVVLKGDRVKFVNQDEIEHSVFSTSPRNSFPDDVHATRKETTHVQTFANQGTVRIQCDIHATMRADVLVLQNGFFARPDRNGNWRISGLTKSDYTLVVWEPNGGEVERKVTGCVTGPVSVSVAEKREGLPRRKNGAPYDEFQY